MNSVLKYLNSCSLGIISTVVSHSSASKICVLYENLMRFT